jgi:hypothetical protein
MARVPVEEYYNIQRNILDRVDTDSIDSDQLKGIAALFGLDVLERLMKRKDEILDDNIEAIQKEEIIRNGRNDVLWKKRNKVLEDDILIKKDPLAFFDADAESAFNNPSTHEESKYKKDNPDWVFNAEEFADENSPMYKVKEKWKQNYINEVLLATHNKRYNEIDQTILTFDEYNANNRELTKHEIEYAKRPSERSLLRQWNLFGRKRTAKLKSDYELAKKEAETIRLEREGYLIGTIDPKTNKIIPNDLSPVSHLTKELYATGEIYNEFEFINTDNYKALSTQGKEIALKMFKDNEAFGDRNDAYELSKIFTGVSLSEEEHGKLTKFNYLKYNDPDFKKDKPQRVRGESREQYEARDDFITWKAGVDEAYGVDTPRYIRAREKAGYDITMSEKMNLAIEENFDYFLELSTAKRKFVNKEITKEKFDDEVTAYKQKTISYLIQKELGTSDDINEFVNGISTLRITQFQNNLTTPVGQQLVDDWFDDYNQRLINAGRPPALEADKINIYSTYMTKHILDGAAFLNNLLVTDEAGSVGYDEKNEYVIQSSLVD